MASMRGPPDGRREVTSLPAPRRCGKSWLMHPYQNRRAKPGRSTALLPTREREAPVAPDPVRQRHNYFRGSYVYRAFMNARFPVKTVQNQPLGNQAEQRRRCFSRPVAGLPLAWGRIGFRPTRYSGEQSRTHESQPIPFRFVPALVQWLMRRAAKSGKCLRTRHSFVGRRSPK